MAFVQSNNPFSVEISDPIIKDDYLSVINNYDLIVLASLKNTREFPKTIDQTKKILIIIGPEGGLSETEEINILSHKNVAPLQLPTYILRAPNAVTAVLASYRGFDTLGEVTVIFTSGIGVLALLTVFRSRRKPRKRHL